MKEEDGSRTSDDTATSVGETQTLFAYQLPRDPCSFSGRDDEDPDKWLKDYERILNYNRWDESMRLANVVLYLTGTARLWFDNNEDLFKSWPDFSKHFKETLGRPEDRKTQAEELLRTRAQRPGETFEPYVQDVLSLCRRVDKAMTEDKKISHLMKGIAEDLYQILINKETSTVDRFVTCCRDIDAMRRRRILKPRYERLPNVTQVSALTGEDLGEMIRRIVREEIRKVLPQVTSCSNVDQPTLETAIREEVQSTLAPLSREEPGMAFHENMRSTTGRNSWQTRPGMQQNSRPSTGRTDLWRTADNVPVCFHCGRAGHVMRYCRDRRRIFDEARSRREQGRFQPWDTDSVSDYGQDTAPNRRYRSDSPYRRRNPIRSQSRSPVRRSSRSPNRGSEEN